jgi:hypothetical protein
MADMTIQEAVGILEVGRDRYRAFERLADALRVAANAVELGDKAELRRRDLEAKVAEKQGELAKLAETLLAASSEAEKHLAKRKADREALDSEYSGYKAALEARRSQLEQEHAQRLATVNAALAEYRRQEEAKSAAAKAAAAAEVEKLNQEVSALEAKKSELATIVNAMRDRMSKV